jgi:hypothetical protein
MLVALLANAGLILADDNETGPGPDFQPARQPPLLSPDGQIEIRQYFEPGDKYIFEFWTFDRETHHAHCLNPNELEPPEYPAGFRFSRDSRWLVRMQKVAAGESTLFLYKREGITYVPATRKPLGDLAWDFFFTQPESKTINRDNLSPETYLVSGFDNNYAGMGEHWPDSRYIIISLGSGESGTARIGPWYCVYDPVTGAFSLPPDIAAFNKSKMPWK